MNALELGLRGEAKLIVDETNTATTCASGALPVFATPAMLSLMEKAAHESLLPYLAQGEASVGTHLDVRHLAATPLGMAVRAESELVGIDRRRLVFRVRAFDDRECIGEGLHERFVVDIARFMAKCEAKKD